MEMRQTKKKVEPNWSKLADSLREVGYTNYEAIQDLMDNAFDAGAKNINVTIEGTTTPTKHVEKIIISDDGCGMDMSTLENALRLGSAASYTDSSLGKFGMGLITASISMGKRLRIFTLDVGSSVVNYALYDLDEVIESGDNVVTFGIMSFEDFKKYNGLPINKLHRKGSSGTLVILDKLDKVTTKDANQMADTLRGKSNCARTYRFLLEDPALQLNVNGKAVVPYDVLGCKKIGQNNSLIHPLTNGLETGTYVNKETGESYSYRYRSTYAAPATSGSGGGTKRYRAAPQGISLMRNRREICFGKTFGMYKQTTNSVGFQVEILASAEVIDELVGVTFSKNGVSKGNDFVDQGFKDHLGENVVNPAKKIAAALYKKGITRSVEYDHILAEEVTFSKRIERLSGLLEGMPDPIPKSKTSGSTSRKRSGGKDTKTPPSPRSVGRSHKRPDVIFKIQLMEGWHKASIVFDYDEERDYATGKSTLTVQLNAEHPFIVNNYIQGNVDQRIMVRTFFCAQALVQRGMFEEHEEAWERATDNFSKNLSIMESSHV